jgi:hypothetical protein
VNTSLFCWNSLSRSDSIVSLATGYAMAQSLCAGGQAGHHGVHNGADDAALSGGSDLSPIRLRACSHSSCN